LKISYVDSKVAVYNDLLKFAYRLFLVALDDLKFTFTVRPSTSLNAAKCTVSKVKSNFGEGKISQRLQSPSKTPVLVYRGETAPYTQPILAFSHYSTTPNI